MKWLLIASFAGLVAIMSFVKFLRPSTVATTSVLAQPSSPSSYQPIVSVPAMRQTVKGNTVTLHPVYADANRIVLTYSLSLAPSNDPRAEVPFPVDRGDPPLNARSAFRLFDESGEFPHTFAYHGWLFNGKIIGGSREPGTEVLVFDTSSRTMLLSRLDLRLELDIALIRIPNNSGGVIGLGVYGPFVFDFSMPVDPVRRVALINQTIRTPLELITLEKVVVTRQETRLFIRFADRKDDYYWSAGFELTVGSYSSEMRDPAAALLYRTDSLGKDYVSIRFLGAPLMEAVDEWQVNVVYHYGGGDIRPDRQEGTFRFAVPPAETHVEAAASPTVEGTPFIPGMPACPIEGHDHTGAPTPDTSTPEPVEQVVEQKVGGYIVRLQPVDADANRVVLRYVIQDEQGNNLDSYGVARNNDSYVLQGPQLLANAGEHLPIIDARYPAVPEGDPFAEGIEVTFDTNPLIAIPSELKLQLTLDPNLGRQSSPPLPPLPQPFVLNISMPMDTARRVAEGVHEAKSEHGTGMSLVRVIATDSETHFIWRVEHSLFMRSVKCAQLIGTLQAGTWSGSLSRLSSPADAWQRGNVCTYRLVGPAPFSQANNWALQVDTIALTYRGGTISTSGPWVFPFTMP